MDFTKMKNYMDRLWPDFRIPGADVIVYQKDQCIFRYMTGYSDDAKTKPMKGDEMFFLYSASKVITCTAAMLLIEDGKISLEDEAGKFYPAFYDMKVKTADGLQKMQNKLTVKALLTMTGGLNYDLNTEPLQQFKAMETHENIMEEAMNAIAASPLDFEPTTHYQYSLCHDVIGGIIEKASGMTFGAFLKQRLFDPIGMTETYFSFDESQNPRFMEQYLRQEDGADKVIPKKCDYSMIPGYESGGAGLVSTVEDYGKFVSMLANGGVAPNGNRIMTPESIELLRTPSLNAQCDKEFVKAYQGYTYGLGVRVMAHREEFGAKAPNGEFGWDGAASAYNFIDPDNGLSLFYMQHVRGCGVAYDVIHPALRDLVYECMGL